MKIFVKIIRNFPKRQETKQKNRFSHKFQMQTYFSVRPIWKISGKPFSQCFTCRHTFSGSRVIAEKTPSKTTSQLLWSLKGFKLFKLWTLNQCFSFFSFVLLRMKFSNVEVVGRIQIGKKKHLTNRQLHLQHW